MAQLVVKDLSLSWGKKTVFSGLNFSLDQGDWLCIAGENGCGKSTLIKSLVGLKPATEGEVVFENGLSERQFGYLPQINERQKDFPASVREIVMSGFLGRKRIFSFYTLSEKKTAEKILRQLNFDSSLDKSFRELSGGQQQRVLLARAMCASRKVLFLDEPVTGLDPDAASKMYSAIAALNSEFKITVVMVSHDIERSMEYATHVLRLDSRKFFGTTKEYREFISKEKGE